MDGDGDPLAPHSQGYVTAPLLFCPRLIELLLTKMVEEGLGWETHDVEYVPFPSGYRSWGTNIVGCHN